MSVAVTEKKWRKSIPEEHRKTLDTRLLWLWHQRFGTVQMIWKESDDMLDHTACTIILQAIAGNDLNNISLLVRRLEGGAQTDEKVAGLDLRI